MEFVITKSESESIVKYIESSPTYGAKTEFSLRLERSLNNKLNECARAARVSKQRLVNKILLEYVNHIEGCN